MTASHKSPEASLSTDSRKPKEIDFLNYLRVGGVAQLAAQFAEFRAVLAGLSPDALRWIANHKDQIEHESRCTRTGIRTPYTGYQG